MAKRAKDRSLEDRLVDGFFAAAESYGWRRLRMQHVAEAADCDLAEAIGRFPNPASILCHVIGRADRAALAEIKTFSDEDSTRDRLFALLMARFDAVAPYRAGIAAILRDGFLDPGLGLLIATRGLCAMTKMLEAAGVATTGPVGLARAQGLVAVNANAVRVWIRDDTPDLSHTMAALDKGLARAEMIARSLDPAARKSPPPPVDEPENG